MTALIAVASTFTHITGHVLPRPEKKPDTAADAMNGVALKQSNRK